MLEVIEEAGRAGRGLHDDSMRACCAKFVPLVRHRITGIVSRGGALLAHWMTRTRRKTSCTSISTRSANLQEA